MKRRRFNLLAGTSLGALSITGSMSQKAMAQSAPDASLLKTTLTPIGAERAGNAAGTIPAWTGGMTEIPAGFTWDTERELPPDWFASDAMLYEVNASNMSQHASVLTDGVKHMITTYGYTLQVYPTHRTSAMPQWVYDNIALNVTRAQLNPQGGRFGFSGAYGGVPFPIPDTSNPLNGGAMCIWNHEARWCGSYEHIGSAGFVVVNGVVSLAQASHAWFIFPYYQEGGSPETYNGLLYEVGGPGGSIQFAPAGSAGQATVAFGSSDSIAHPNITWQVLPGQGRVRKAPQTQYDVPSTYTDGINNFDEIYGFNGAADEYDWKLIGKQEVLIPYNGNKLFNNTSGAAHGPKFLNPDFVRWELHRCWVVEATVHPGRRNVLATRKLYFDEDTWAAVIIDSWDANNNIFRNELTFNGVFPNLPGTIMTNMVVYNLQTTDYVTLQGPWIDPPYNTPWTFEVNPMSYFNPQTMAAGASY
jgi:hypothetical protein